jgi:sugar phosphate isomerase/epimerase
MIDRDRLYETGAPSRRHRSRCGCPTWAIDWSLVFGALYRAGYEGDCIIEHEDRKFGGTDSWSSAASCSPATRSGGTWSER